MVDNRNSKERVIFFFAGFLQIVKAGVKRSILQIDWFGMLCHETDEALAQSEAYMSHRFLLETFRCHQHVGIDITVQQIDRTNLGLECEAYTADNNIQRRLQIPGRVYFLYYATQSFQHACFRFGSGILP